MKRITTLMLLILAVTLLSCNQTGTFDEMEAVVSENDFFKPDRNQEKPPTQLNYNGFSELTELPGCTEPTVLPLTAGQHIDVGTLVITNDENNIYVTYDVNKTYGDLDSDWYLKETHLFVGCSADDIPINSGGNPVIGHFPYSNEHGNVKSYTYEIPLSEFDCHEAIGDCLVISAHASVVNLNSNLDEVDSETAFGGCTEGFNFPGQRWGCYFDYCTVECEEESSFGWLYKTTNPELYVTCVKDNNDFGFSNEVHYGWLMDANPFYPIWMKVEDDCGIDNVVQVGNIWLSVVVEDSKPKIKLEIKMIGSNTIDMLSVYVGWTNPVVNGELNQSLENYTVNDDNFIYFKEVSSMLGTAPSGSNPEFYIIAKTKLQ